MHSRTDIAALLSQHGLAPRRDLGQNFVVDANTVRKIARLAEVGTSDHVVEIGAGLGSLTLALAETGATITAIEVDRGVAAALRTVVADVTNVKVVEDDAMRLDWTALLATSPQWVLVANLPYNVASPIMFKLVELHAAGVPLVDATLMLQREVADRLVAPPGSRDYGVLSILIGHAADVETVLKLPAGAFRPPPTVLSSLVRLRFRPPRPPVKDAAFFGALVQAVFTRRRKTLANALLALDGRSGPPLARPAEALAAAGLDGSRRPETLSIAEFAILADIYSSAPRSAVL